MSWMRAREGWWEDWAVDTVNFIREIDPDRGHEIYIEDSINSITNPNRPTLSGLDFARVARHFDAVGGYTEPTWTSDVDSSKNVQVKTLAALATIRNEVGPMQQIIFTFWTANHAEERKPGPAVHPTALEIEQVCEDALRFGIRHLDMYGYSYRRIPSD